MKILFVTHGSPTIGGGHVMRSLTLAHALADRGAQVKFVVNAQARIVVPNLAHSIFSCEIVEDFAAATGIAARWAGVDAIVCDSYEIDVRLERALRCVANRIAVIDDLANREHECDLLIDASFGRHASDYAGLIPATAKVLAGAHYAMLRPEFALHRAEAFKRRRAALGVSRVLVSLGLTDLNGITAPVVAALAHSPHSFSVDVVVGLEALSRSALEEMCAKDERIILHVHRPNMARLMTDADVAVGAAGTTTWERCCLGLPTAMLVLAENQRYIAEKLTLAGAVTIIEQKEGSFDLLSSMSRLIEDREFRLRQAEAAAAIVDGNGAERIADWIVENAQTQ